MKIFTVEEQKRDSTLWRLANIVDSEEQFKELLHHERKIGFWNGYASATLVALMVAIFLYLT